MYIDISRQKKIVKGPFKHTKKKEKRKSIGMGNIVTPVSSVVRFDWVNFFPCLISIYLKFCTQVIIYLKNIVRACVCGFVFWLKKREKIINNTPLKFELLTPAAGGKN
jgi:maltodextrin utilization protein YvdJ